MIGKTLAHYEILEPLGAGGMGEVYRAWDTRLQRDVALKLLLPELAADPERRARLEREAQMLARLDHQNIAAIHGFEEAQPPGGEPVRFLVMQLVAGETLAQRLSHGPLPLGTALSVGFQICEALDAAHDRGVVHRDLKPANVKVGEDTDGRLHVKVLDFGLAKAFEPEDPTADRSPDLSASPTMAAATRAGVILGTAAYMSPEQARGKPIDKRTDVWAFGCVLFEMLAGRQSFEADTVADAIAAVVRGEPQWDLLPASVPEEIRRLLGRCLDKDLRRRLRDIGEARLVIEDCLAESGTGGVVASPTAPPAAGREAPIPGRRGEASIEVGAPGSPDGGPDGAEQVTEQAPEEAKLEAARQKLEATEDIVARAQKIKEVRAGLKRSLPEQKEGGLGARAGKLLWVAAGLVLGVAGTWMVLGIGSVPGPTGDRAGTLGPTMAGAVDLAGAAPLAFGSAAIGFDSPLLAISPDGRWLVYVGLTNQGQMIYRHRLDGFGDPEAIRGTEGAIHPFFPPNGERLGFLTDDRLKTVSLEGGDVQTISPVRTAVRAVWTRDDWIYFSNDQGAAWRRVRNDGSGAEDIVIEGELIVLSDVHPDGRWALAVDHRRRGISADYWTILVVDLETEEVQSEFEYGYDARWVGEDHVVLARGGNLMAAPFDARRGVIEGDAEVIVQGVAMDSLFANAQIAVSASGSLAFIPGGDLSVGRVVWIDRDDGEDHPLALDPLVYGELDLAPDDRSLAVHVADVEDYVSIYDLDSASSRKLLGTENGGYPRWAREGSSVLWAARGLDQTEWRVLTKEIDSADAPRVLATSPRRIRPSNSLPDGSRLLMQVQELGSDYAFVDTDDPESLVWHEGRADVGIMLPAFSPDGTHLAYASDESGNFEITIRPYPDGPPRQFSGNGGAEFVWCPCGEIVFRQGTRWFAKAISATGGFGGEPAEEVFQVEDFVDTPGRSFDISSDGQRLFVVRRAEPAVDTRIHVVANWLEDLRRRLSAEDEQ